MLAANLSQRPRGGGAHVALGVRQTRGQGLHRAGGAEHSQRPRGRALDLGAGIPQGHGEHLQDRRGAQPQEAKGAQSRHTHGLFRIQGCLQHGRQRLRSSAAKLSQRSGDGRADLLLAVAQGDDERGHRRRRVLPQPLQRSCCRSSDESVAICEAISERWHGTHHHVDSIPVAPVARAVRQRLDRAGLARHVHQRLGRIEPHPPPGIFQGLAQNGHHGIGVRIHQQRQAVPHRGIWVLFCEDGRMWVQLVSQLQVL
mmetsp:Transcript_78032/g.187088  ORF Transcript_78032/g.187088 Transcript_78032/m.187088 type:complete len:256 (-) Transcript_78032:1158-1925(-)